MPSFDNALTETIDEVIRNVFKDEMAKVILDYFGNSSSKKIDERLQIFSDALPKVLGIGSVIIQDLILENLYSKFELQLKWKKDYSFKEYILELRSKIGIGEGDKLDEAQPKIIS